MVTKSDEELYREFRRANGWGQSDVAFRQLYSRHSGPLFRFIYRFTANQQAADDVLQDIFLELLAGKYNDTNSGSLKNWLYTVAKNKGLNWIKRKRHETTDEAVLENLQDGVDSEAELIQANLLEHLSRIESKLPPELLSPWSLRKSGLDNAQIATELSIPVGTVKSRFFRLVEVIRKELINENSENSEKKIT